MTTDHHPFTEMLNHQAETTRIYDAIKSVEPVVMGYMSSDGFRKDPKRITFTAARYKFVAKMLEGKATVLEIGAGDGFFSAIVRQHVEHLTLSDLDGTEKILKHDFLKAPMFNHFDGAYLLDVLEHIPREQEDIFLSHIRQSTYGPVIVGMPSLMSQQYASELSRQGHVNCKDKEGFRSTLLKHWPNVFVFGMCDETLHTGFIANYWLAVCV